MDILQNSSKIYKIGKYKYAFGLFWQSYNPDITKDPKKEAKKLIKEIKDFDLYVKRENDEPQYGLGKTKNGLIGGSISAAAVAAKSIRGSWVGVFRLTDGWWYCKVNSDHIDPEGDIFFENEEDAQNFFEREIRENTFEKIYAPAHWNKSYVEKPITEILGSAKSPRLENLKTNQKTLGYIAIGGLCAVGLLMAGVWYKDYKETKQKEEAMKKVAEQIVKIKEPAKIAEQEKTWEKKPIPKDFIAACHNFMNASPKYLPGYTLMEISCKPGQLLYSYTQAYGYSYWLDYLQNNYDLSPGSLSVTTDGKAADYIVPLPTLQPRGQEDLFPTDQHIKSLTQLSQTLKDGLEIGQPRLPAIPVGADPKQYPPPKFAPMSVKITTKNLTHWEKYIENYAGFIINGINFDPKNTLWTITGDIYVQL